MFANAHFWRRITFLLCLACVGVMLVPGSHIYYTDAGRHIASYIWNHAMPHSLFGFLAALLAMLSSLWGMKKGKSVAQPMLIFNTPAICFSFMVASFGADRILHESLVFLNILPVLLSAAAMATSIVAWFAGRKKA